MSTIGEITELSFPKTESVGVRLSVALLETKDGIFGQVRVRGNEVAHAVVTGHGVDRSVATVSVLMENVGVTMREGSSLDILSTDSDVVSLVNESGKSKGLGSTPVDSLTGIDRLLTINENLSDLRVEVAFRRKSGDLVSNFTKSCKINSSVLQLSILLGVLDFLPLGVNPVLSIKLKILTLLISLVKSGLSLLINIRESLLGDSFVDELLSIHVSHWVHVLDDGVHEWLGVGWLIKFVVTHLTVADEVDDNITAKLLSVLSSDAECVGNIVHLVSVNVENRGADCSCNFRTVSARSCAVGSRRETNLVVNDDVNGATDSVVLQLLHLEALVDDTLSGDGGITVDHDGDDLLAVLLLTTKEVLLGTSASSHTRVHSLQMRGVSHQSQLDFMACFAISSAESGTQMILDVTSASVDGLFTLLRLNTLELSHDDLHGLAHNVCQSVQTASMGHTDHKGSCTLLDS